MDQKLHQAKDGSDKLKMDYDLAIFLSVNSAWNSDLWAMFEHVLAIFMSWSY